MKTKALSLLLVLPLVSSCSKAVNLKKVVFAFDTAIEVSLFEGDETNISDISTILSKYDALADNYKERDVSNVYSINQTNNEIEVSEDLYKMLQTTIDISDRFNVFNPFVGSLSKLWKDAISNNQVLASDVIESEVAKIQSSSLTFKEGNIVQRNGEAELDLGAIAKGYVLDQIKDYLDEKRYSKYLINGGRSSILLGEKNSKDGLFSVGLGLDNAYLSLKNCFVSTSSISNQSTVIDGVVYSHIVHPHTGSATPINDTVIVISNKGYVGDATSTLFMNCSIDEIKNFEEVRNVKTIVINDNKIEYCHPNLEVKYH